MGLPWQTRLNSSIIDGVDRDARAVADRVGRAVLTQT
jgi:putative flavoprotein involved in K+ transport